MEQDRTNVRTVTPLEVATRLRDLGQRIAPAEISDVWVFPPLAHLEGSAEFLLFTRILPDEMRRVCGAEFSEDARRNGPAGENGNGNGHVVAVAKGNGNGNGNGDGEGGGNLAGGAQPRRITEYGAVPMHRVPRVVAGFRERLGDHREPLHFEIGGSAESWSRLTQTEELPSD